MLPIHSHKSSALKKNRFMSPLLTSEVRRCGSSKRLRSPHQILPGARSVLCFLARVFAGSWVVGH
jgi:hypothetical protein